MSEYLLQRKNSRCLIETLYGKHLALNNIILIVVLLGMYFLDKSSPSFDDFTLILLSCAAGEAKYASVVIKVKFNLVASAIKFFAAYKILSMNV